MSWWAATMVTDDGEQPLLTLPVADVVSAALASDEDASRPRWAT